MSQTDMKENSLQHDFLSQSEQLFISFIEPSSQSIHEVLLQSVHFSTKPVIELHAGQVYSREPVIV